MKAEAVAVVTVLAAWFVVRHACAKLQSNLFKQTSVPVTFDCVESGSVGSGAVSVSWFPWRCGWRAWEGAVGIADCACGLTSLDITRHPGLTGSIWWRFVSKLYTIALV